MRAITKLEYSLIESKVKAVSSRIKDKNLGTCFLHLVVDTLFPRMEEDIASVITDGGSDRGADAVYIQEKSESVYISIVQSKYAQKFDNAKRNFPGNEVDKLISLIRDICDKSDALLSSVNPILRGKVQDIWKLIGVGKTIYFRIFLASNTLPLVHHERERLQSFCRQYDFVSLEELSFSTLTNLLSSEDRPKSAGELDCIDLQRYERIDCDIRGLIANVDALSFIKMISTEDGSSIKRHLFDENIRGYLGLEGGFNREILSSALSDDNHLFWYLNNGITIVAKDFSHQNVRGSKIHINDFQIVNGAQSSYSLFEAHKRNPAKLSEVVLLIKVFASSRQDISEQIAIATNSQARIAPRDLKANDVIQKKIASVFQDNGWLYERKKNQFDDNLDSPKIDSLKLGQAILAYHLGEPHQAKTVSDEIFGNMYSTIFSEDQDAQFLLQLAKLYFFVIKDRELEMGELRQLTGHSEVSEYVAYTQWHILFCISLLAREDDKKIPDEDEFQHYLDKAKDVVGKIAIQNQEKSYYRIFRSSKTKELIKKELGFGQFQFDF